MFLGINSSRTLSSGTSQRPESRRHTGCAGCWWMEGTEPGSDAWCSPRWTEGTEETITLTLSLVTTGSAALRPVLTMMFMLASLSWVLKRPTWRGHTSCSPAKGDTVMVRPTGRIGRLSVNPPSIHVWWHRTTESHQQSHVRCGKSLLTLQTYCKSFILKFVLWILCAQLQNVTEFIVQTKPHQVNNVGLLFWNHLHETLSEIMDPVFEQYQH